MNADIRSMLLELIHASEREHHSYLEALGFDPFRTPRYAHVAKSAPADVVGQGCESGSRAFRLRSILDRFDRERSK